ncbi:MAG: efflux RND transporter periplasmic adaptor subunit [Deltaproteobacteria bacterium]|nr:efflux RND transporter periplasmic adaptor subunit [Deltaproteobacteria bacterium]NIS76159.1 efflux RND transporter periplasmic adaptor subunit [Deltaproteobacteria bacterium]
MHRKCPVFNTLLPCLLSILIAITVPVLAVTAEAGPKDTGEAALPLVTVTAVTVEDVNPPAEYVGHVEAIQAVELRARVQGYLEEVNFKEGSDVRANDLLYLIEQAPYRARVEANKARVAQETANLEKARQYLKRVKSVRTGGVSERVIDDAVADELSAKAKVEEAKANLKLSEIDLGYTEVRAPISGRIGSTALTRGNLVGPDSGSLSRIVQLDPIRIVFSVSESNLAAVKAAFGDSLQDKKGRTMVIRIKIPGVGIFKNEGRVDFVENEVEATTGTIAVRAVFENHNGLLVPGQYVTVLVSQERSARLPVVPQEAVQEDREGRYVLTVDTNNRVVKRPVTTGASIGAKWAVKEGLSGGEMVIVRGIQKVKPGQTVKTTTAKDENGS